MWDNIPAKDLSAFISKQKVRQNHGWEPIWRWDVRQLSRFLHGAQSVVCWNSCLSPAALLIRGDVQSSACAVPLPNPSITLQASTTPRPALSYIWPRDIRVPCPSSAIWATHSSSIYVGVRVQAGQWQDAVPPTLPRGTDCCCCLNASWLWAGGPQRSTRPWWSNLVSYIDTKLLLEEVLLRPAGVLTLWSVWVLTPQYSDGDTILSKKLCLSDEMSNRDPDSLWSLEIPGCLSKRVGVLSRHPGQISPLVSNHHGLLIIPIHWLASSLGLLSTSKLVCGGRSCTIWLPSHHPGGCCTLLVDEEIPPYYVKLFECLEKRYINVTNVIKLCC